MAKIINTAEKGHWYTKDGHACHQVPYAASNKAKAGQLKSTTLTDARKLKLLPSVTQILKLLAKPGLQDWKDEQLLIAADAWFAKVLSKIVSSPELAVETYPGVKFADFLQEIRGDFTEWARTIHRDSKVSVEEAIQRGHRIHEATDQFATRGLLPADPAIQPLFRPFKNWFESHVTNVKQTEFTVVGNGYAGTLDLLATIRGMGDRVVDYKSRGWEPGKKPLIYKEDGMQLAGYRRAVSSSMGGSLQEEIGMTSVFINTKDECPVYVHDWTNEEIRRHERMFMLTFELWIEDKKYDPRL